jgi:DNA primase
VAGSIPAAQIAEVQAATDIVALISESVPLKKKGKDFLGLCPFHQEKTPSFTVSAAKQMFYCFGCHTGGDVIGFVMKHERMTFGEAVQVLADRAGIRLRREGGESPEAARARQGALDVCQWAADEFHRVLVASSAGRPGLEYLTRRGLARETIDRFNLGFAPNAWDHLLGRAPRNRLTPQALEEAGLAVPREDGAGRYDRFRNRVMFPIQDVRGRVVAFGGRTLGEEQPKYLNSPETALFNKGRMLYALNVAKDAAARERRLCVVEGYMDALMAHQHGLDWTVATLGTALTDAHLHLLRRYVEEAVLVFDGDAAGRAATDRGIELFLQQELEVRVCILPDELDPCDLLVERGAEAFKAALDGSQSAFDFKLRDVEQRYDLERDGDKRRAIDEVLDLLAKLPTRTRATWSVRRDQVLARLARRMDVSEGALRARLAGRKRPGALRPDAPLPLGPQDQVERELTEVLVCRPDLAGAVRALLPPEEMRSEDLARVAARVYAAVGDGRPLELRQVLALVAEDNLGALVSDLAARGEAKGRFDERLAAVQARLAAHGARRRRALLRARLARLTSDSQRAAVLRELEQTLRPAAFEAPASTPAGESG